VADDRSPEAGPSLTTVPLGTAVVSQNPTGMLTTPAMASAVAIALWSAEPLVAGVLHYLLPAIPESHRGGLPCLAADSGFRDLLQRVKALAGGSTRLTGWIVGGADPLCDLETPEIMLGARNVEVATRLLADAGIEVAAQRTGGHQSRRLALEIATGKIRVNESPTSQGIS